MIHPISPLQTKTQALPHSSSSLAQVRHLQARIKHHAPYREPSPALLLGASNRFLLPSDLWFD